MALRVRLFVSHLLISALVIGTCVGFVGLLWYRPPLAQIEGIFAILFVMACVDVGAGPLCTLVAASPKKTRNELTRDLAIIGGVQLLALGYAMYTTCIARPAFIVYGEGRFVITHANDLRAEELAKAANAEYSKPPLLGPKYVALKFPEDPGEVNKILQATLSGGPAIKEMPRFYQPWPQGAADIREKAKSLASLPAQSPLREAAMKILDANGASAGDALVAPISGKVAQGTVLVRNSDLSILGIIPYLAP